jgi:ADP-heptose:LPS heptosyltransferase
MNAPNGQPMLLSPQEAMQRFPQLRAQIQAQGNRAAVPPGGNLAQHPGNGEPPRQAGPVDFLVKAYQATGDALMMITAVSHIKRHFGTTYRFAIETNFPELLQNNPWLEDRDELHNPIEIEAGQCWSEINHNSDHLIQEWIRGIINAMSEKLGFRIQEPRMKDFKTAIYLSEAEKAKPITDIVGDVKKFWLLDIGYKPDYPAKQYDQAVGQAVVDALQGKVTFVQIGRELKSGCADDHPPLKGVVNAIGKTENRRDLLRLFWHCEGVVTPISLPMHLAAMPTKTGRLRPCVVIAGARESTAMISYPAHTVLSTIGRLDCCARGACLKVRIESNPDEIKGPSEERCLRPDRGIASCIRLITPAQIIAAVESYLIPPESPKICIATLADGDGEWVAMRRITFPNKQAYAEKHGYGFVGETQVFHEKENDGKMKPDRPAAWTKLPLCLRLMSDYTWIFFSDADALIMNPEIKLESLIDDDYDFIVSEDNNGMNTGHFLIKSTEESWRFLRESWEREHLKDHGCYEQAAMGEWLRAHVKSFEEFNKEGKHKGDKPPPSGDRLRVKIIPQRSFNSYPDNYQPGDFIQHWPRNDAWKNRVELIGKAARELKESKPKPLATEPASV